jgi:hypothetical protein
MICDKDGVNHYFLTPERVSINRQENNAKGEEPLRSAALSAAFLK